MQAYWLAGMEAYLRYADLPGEEPACVYLAGGGLSALGCFAAVAACGALARRRALLPDLLGCGFSDRPQAFGYSLEEHAEVVAALLDGLGLRQCVVIGASLGGAVAITLAARRPELVANLVLLEANLDPADGAFSRGVVAQSEEEFVAQGFAATVEMFRQAGREGDAGAAIVAGMLQVAAPFALHRSLAGLVWGTQPTMREHLYALQIPRTYVFGEQSLPDPDWAELPANGVRTMAVARGGHGMMLENPQGTAEAIWAAMQSNFDLATIK